VRYLSRAQLTYPASVASDDDSTIKVAPKKVAKDKPAGKIKLKTPAPKQNKPGNWRDGSVIDGLSQGTCDRRC
jgi:SAGA-associated factor 73